MIVRRGTAGAGIWFYGHVVRVRPFFVLLVAAVTLVSIRCRDEVPSGVATETRDVPVFLISIDTLRSDRLPAYGYDEGSTPAIDRFRDDALLFERAFSSVPLTLPSHATILTGLEPYRHGVRDNIGYSLEPGAHTLAESLSENGYETGAAVSSYVLRGETGLSQGFDVYDDLMTEAPVDTISSWQRDGEATADAITRWVDSAPGRKLFGFLHLYEPHYPYTPPEPFASRLSDPYDGEVSRADAIVGRFLEHLKERGLYDDSLIIVLSDHGEGLGDHGELEHGVFLYREAIQVPLLIKLPGNERAGETIERPVSLTDVCPTVLTRTGLDPGAGIDGIDLLSFAPPRNRTIYSETYYPRLHYGWSELFSLIGETRHLVDAPRVELYDYTRDPGETENVANEERRTVATLRDAVRELVSAHPFEEPRAADPEDLAKLESLGYLGGGGSAATNDRPDPKDEIDLLTEFGKGAAAFQRADFDEAIAIGRSIVSDNPDFLQGWGLISSASRKKGDYSTALGALESQMERAPTNPQTALALSSVTYEMGRLDLARTYAELATDYAPSIANEMIARIELARENLSEAERAAIAAHEASPSRIEPLMLRSVVEHRKGDFAAELELLNRVGEKVETGLLDPIPELELRRGQCLLQLRRTTDAEQAFRAETEHFPENRAAWVNLALVVGAQGRRDEAEGILDEALQQHPDRKMRRLVDEAREVMRGER